jgi:hypothetical protein
VPATAEAAAPDCTIGTPSPPTPSGALQPGGQTPRAGPAQPHWHSSRALWHQREARDRPQTVRTCRPSTSLPNA